MESQPINLEEAKKCGRFWTSHRDSFELFRRGIDPDVKLRVLEAAAQYEALGAIVEEFDFPMIEYAIPTYYIIACAEACSNLSRFDGIKYGFRAGGRKRSS